MTPFSLRGRDPVQSAARIRLIPALRRRPSHCPPRRRSDPCLITWRPRAGPGFAPVSRDLNREPPLSPGGRLPRGGPLRRPNLEAPAVATAPSTASPHRSVDARGRALPMTDAEIRARAEVAIRALDAIDDMGDAEEQRQTLDALIEALNADPLSDRKRFGPGIPRRSRRLPRPRRRFEALRPRERQPACGRPARPADIPTSRRFACSVASLGVS